MCNVALLQAQNYGIGGHYDPHFDFARVRFVIDFQVANYGIGGHYEPHYDMSTVSDVHCPLTALN